MKTHFLNKNKNRSCQGIALIVSCLLLITACSDKTQAVKSGSGSNNATTGSLPQYPLSNISEKAWLRKQLPSNSLAYARVPSAWYLFSGQDNGFKYAQGNPDFVEQVTKIQASIKRSIFTHFKLDNGLAKFLLQHVDGPIEAAVLQPELGQVMPIISLATHLDFTSLNEFQRTFTDVLASDQMLQHTQASDSSGVGQLSFQGQNIVYYYNEQTQQFSLFGGMNVSVDALNTTRLSLVSTDNHPMFAVEEAMDASGLGLFVWLSPKMILPAAMPMISEQQIAQLKMLGLADVNGIALGYGVSQGKTRLKTLIDMPMAGMRQYLPAVNNNITLTSAGEVKSFALLSLPTGEDVTKFEQGLTAITGELSPSYLEVKETIQTELGLSLEELLNLVGPEVVYFSDDVSDFAAIKLNDEQKFNALLKKLQTNKVIQLSEHKVNGSVIYQAISSSDMMEGVYVSMFKDAPYIAELLKNIKSRSYWIIDNGYLITSSIPQPLIERGLSKDKRSIEKWLTEKQQQNLSGSLLAYSSSIDDLSRNSYHIYLAMLQLLADVSEAEFDVFALPLANELAFEDQGTIGLQLDLSNPYIALEFTFEQSMLDILYGGGYETTAVIGILAAVALPAYQDYTKRAKAAEQQTK